MRKKLSTLIILGLVLVLPILSIQMMFNSTNGMNVIQNVDESIYKKGVYTEVAMLESIPVTIIGSIDYAGSPDYDDVRNAHEIDGGYILMHEESNDLETYWDFVLDTSYDSITEVFINIWGMDFDASGSIDDLDIYNFGTLSWETIVNNALNNDIYGWNNNSKLIDLSYLEGGSRIRIRFFDDDNVGSSGEWRVEYIECRVSGSLDVNAPTISDLSVYPATTKFTNTTLTVNCTTTDESAITVQYNFTGDIGLAENLTFLQDVVHYNGDEYTHSLRLPDGNWTVIATVTDAYENVATAYQSFTVLPQSGGGGGATEIDPVIFFSTNASELYPGDTAQITVYAQNGSNNLDCVWLYDGVLDSNVTLEDNINAKVDREYLYNTTTNLIGEYGFIFYVNDSAGTIVYFNWSNTLETITPTFNPVFYNVWVNDTSLGIGHYAQINFSVESTKWDLDDVWIFDPTDNLNHTIATDVGDNLLHTYTYDVTSPTEGYQQFILYANNTFPPYALSSSTFTIIRWGIIRDQNLPQFTLLTINDSSLQTGQYASITWNISSGEYDLNTTWIYDPTISQYVSVAEIGAGGTFQFNYIAYSGSAGTYDFILYVNDTYNNLVTLETQIRWFPTTGGDADAIDEVLIITVSLIGVINITEEVILEALIFNEHNESKQVDVGIAIPHGLSDLSAMKYENQTINSLDYELFDFNLSIDSYGDYEILVYVTYDDVFEYRIYNLLVQSSLSGLPGSIDLTIDTINITAIIQEIVLNLFPNITNNINNTIENIVNTTNLIDVINNITNDINLTNYLVNDINISNIIQNSFDPTVNITNYNEFITNLTNNIVNDINITNQYTINTTNYIEVNNFNNFSLFLNQTEYNELYNSIYNNLTNEIYNDVYNNITNVIYNNIYPTIYNNFSAEIYEDFYNDFFNTFLVTLVVNLTPSFNQTIDIIINNTINIGIEFDPVQTAVTFGWLGLAMLGIYGIMMAENTHTPYSKMSISSGGSIGRKNRKSYDRRNKGKLSFLGLGKISRRKKDGGRTTSKHWYNLLPGVMNRQFQYGLAIIGFVVTWIIGYSVIFPNLDASMQLKLSLGSGYTLFGGHVLGMLLGLFVVFLILSIDAFIVLVASLIYPMIIFLILEDWIMFSVIFTMMMAGISAVITLKYIRRGQRW
jgi:hypothetical protein